MRGVTLALFVALAAAASNERKVPNFKDLLESLNTTEPFWKKKQNYTPEYNCTFAMKVDLNDTMYIFNQTYRNYSEEIKKTLFASLKNGPPPVMNVSMTPGGQGIPYTLQYWNSTEKCGILTFPRRSKENAGCEMHVWDSRIEKGNEDCQRNYTDICINQEYPVYYESCKLKKK
ncbi:uncharacterized protein LOC144152625 [Haemaphysalis longicornis]